MKKYGIILVVGFLMINCLDTLYSKSKWDVAFDESVMEVNLIKNNKPFLQGFYASYKLDDKVITTKEYSGYKIKKETIKDSFGKGTLYRITYKDDKLPTVVQSFYLFPNEDYLLTEFTVESTVELYSNYMAPVNVNRVSDTFSGDNHRALFVPFDNDNWGRFRSHPFTFEKLMSYEVSAVFDNNTREGLIIGSVEHDTWKSAVEISTNTSDKLEQLLCYGGIADELTRDSKVHGALIGKKIKSPKVFIGFFEDWRTGMEIYAKTNTRIAPRKKWDKAVPFGWNSWGVLQFNITAQKALEVSDFFKNNLPSFINQDKTVVIWLDSGWSNFPEEQLKAFVDTCKANGQVAGVYWVPFTDWGKNPERDIKEAPEYKYKDVYLYANGKPQDLDGAYAIDPTHPAIEAQIKRTAELFHHCGFEFVKIDFLTHGALEADKWYNQEIKTGMQAYNYGLNLLNQYAGDMFINFSISPVFPANYAHSRRIACDAWNKIKDTEYTLNALSYGWWIGSLYHYNDADHVVLRDASESENRARITSSAITGLYITGDDFSLAGSEEGKDRARKFLTNKDINDMARGISFRPIEGNGDKSENQFVHIDESSHIYYVVFNYDETDIQISIPFSRIGLDPSRIFSAKELWSGDNIDVHAQIHIPAKDVKVIKLQTK
jgi:alpha-galactosidase